MSLVQSTDALISSLKPYKYNSRKHPEHQVKALAASIEKFGFTQPIVCTENFTILAGHGRFEAAKILGLAQVPIRIVSNLSSEEKKAYIIADNKISEQSEWDQDNLLHELSELQGFDAGSELNSLLDQTTFLETKAQQVSLDKIKPHPRNYKSHPPEQLEHLKKSIEENGIYRNILVAEDYTILAGHGVVEAAVALGLTSVPILRINISPNDPKALKLLTADNEVSHLAESNMREMSEILKELLVEDDLLGTGYDKQKLENLLLVSRSKDELKAVKEEEGWGDYMDFDPLKPAIKLVINFENENDRQDFAKTIGAQITEKTKFLWWPFKEKQKHAHLEYQLDESE
tara:strand:- start:1761 stop:2795 length:1035 start_codon:yes stop_codon:yes gene_type:complete